MKKFKSYKTIIGKHQILAGLDTIATSHMNEKSLIDKLKWNQKLSVIQKQIAIGQNQKDIQNLMANETVFRGKV